MKEIICVELVLQSGQTVWWPSEDKFPAGAGRVFHSQPERPTPVPSTRRHNIDGIKHAKPKYGVHP